MKTFTEQTGKKPTLVSTLSLIKKAHAGQKYGNEPYWKHPQAVANKGKEIFGSKFGTAEYAAALLHDVIEDTEYGIEDLKKLGYVDSVLDAVVLVTKIPNTSYDENIDRIIKSGNKTAMMVKFADNFMNYTGDKSGWNPEKAAKSQAKYMKSMKKLGSKLGVDPNDFL